MACGCSRNRTYTESNPLMLGDPNGDPPIYLRATIALMGMKANSAFWATGSSVAAMIDAGWLVVL